MEFLLARKKAKIAAKAALARKNWAKRGKLYNQVSEALNDGKLVSSVKEIADEEAYKENKNKAKQDRKHRHAAKEDFAWSGIEARSTVRKMKAPKTEWTWEEGSMAKISRVHHFFGIPKNAICMIISSPQQHGNYGEIQVLYDGQPYTLSAAVLRPIGWIEED